MADILPTAWCPDITFTVDAVNGDYVTIPLACLSNADITKVEVDYRQLWLRIMESMVAYWGTLDLVDRPTKITACEKSIIYTSSTDTYRVRFNVELETTVGEIDVAPEPV